MIVFNGIDLIILTIGLVLIAFCGILIVVDRIAYAVKKCKQKRGEEGKE